MVCYESYPNKNLTRLACGCSWCFDCLNHKVQTSLAIYGVFPPKCCNDPAGTINIVDVQQCLNDENAVRAVVRWDELHSPNPTYCSKAACGVFIPDDAPHPYQDSRFVACPECETVTCTLCKGAWDRHDVPEKCPDLISAEDKTLLGREGWRQCPNKSCRRVIEKASGCDRLHCVCGTEFCYRCGAGYEEDKNGILKCQCSTLSLGVYHGVGGRRLRVVQPQDGV